MAKTKVLICPYCGETQPQGERCRSCNGLFEPLSRRATHNAMGPWFLRDPKRPFQPGCSYETLVKLVERKQVDHLTIVRGPTTRQFWTIARRVPGIAHLLGYCHNCDAPVDGDDHGCHACGVPFGAYMDRNFLGLPDINPLPWEADVDNDDQPAALRTSNGGGYANGPRGQRGISSFASDEELLADAEFGQATIVRPQTQTATESDEGESSFDVPATLAETETATQTETRSDDTVLRSTQRRLAQQQRNVRVLGIVAAVALLAALIATIAAMRGGAPAEVPKQNLKKPIDAATIGSSSNAIEDSNDAPAAAMDDNSEGTAEIADGTEEDVSTPADRPTELQQQHDEALALLTAAEDEDRLLAERIADYERAIDLLKSIERKGQPGEKPVDLATTIETAERELERLRLREFFP